MTRRTCHLPGGITKLVGNERQKLRFALGEGGEKVGRRAEGRDLVEIQRSFRQRSGKIQINICRISRLEMFLVSPQQQNSRRQSTLGIGLVQMQRPPIHGN